MRRVLVTGANGFIGRHVCEDLANRGVAVKGAWRGRGNFPIEHRLVAPVEIDDVESFDRWRELDCDVDVVVHLAARVHVKGEKREQHLPKYRQTNVEGTMGLARAAAECGVGRFVFMSSVAVVRAEAETLSMSGGAPQYRESDPSGAVAPYGQSKLEAERALVEFARQTEMDVVILRPPLVYGAHVPANFLRLLEFVDRGLPWPCGRMKNSRSYLYVGNLASAIYAAASHPAAAGETFFVRDGRDLSTSELIDIIAEVMGRNVLSLPMSGQTLATFGGRLGLAKRLKPLFGSLRLDDSKVRSLLGWKPPFSVEEGIEQTVRWYEERDR